MITWSEDDEWHLLWDTDHPRWQYVKISEKEGRVLLAPAKLDRKRNTYFADEAKAEEAEILEKRKDFLCHCFIIRDRQGKLWQIYWDSTDCYYNLASGQEICRECEIVKRWQAF